MPSCTNQYTGITVCILCMVKARHPRFYLSPPFPGERYAKVYGMESWLRQRGSSSQFVGCCRGMVGYCLLIRSRIEGSNRVTGCCVWTRIAIPTSSHVLVCCALVVRISRLEQHHDLDLDLGLRALDTTMCCLTAVVFNAIGYGSTDAADDAEASAGGGALNS